MYKYIYLVSYGRQLTIDHLANQELAEPINNKQWPSDQVTALTYSLYIDIQIYLFLDSCCLMIYSSTSRRGRQGQVTMCDSRVSLVNYQDSLRLYVVTVRHRRDPAAE